MVMMSSVSFLIGYSVAIFQFHGNIYLHLWHDSIVKTLLLLVVLASFSIVAWLLDISIGQSATDDSCFSVFSVWQHLNINK